MPFSPHRLASVHHGEGGINFWKMFKIKMFNGEWDEAKAPLVESEMPMIVSTITAHIHEIVLAAAWLVKVNPHLEIEFEKGLNMENADNFIKNRATIVFKAKLRQP